MAWTKKVLAKIEGKKILQSTIEYFSICMVPPIIEYIIIYVGRCSERGPQPDRPEAGPAVREVGHHPDPHDHHTGHHHHHPARGGGDQARPHSWRLHCRVF